MTPEAARQVLALWHPAVDPARDPEMAEALRLARQDPALREWFEAHARFQSNATQAVQAIPLPKNLAEAILAARRTARPEFRQDRRRIRTQFAVAATLVALGVASALLWNPGPKPPEFATFRNRTVRGVQREYRMDIVSTDLAAIRTFMASHQAPSDFTLPPRLGAEPAVGGGLIPWQGKPAAMVCLGGGAKGMIYLFVLPADQAGAGAPTAPETLQVGKLPTVAWTSGSHTFLLAADRLSLEELRGYL